MDDNVGVHFPKGTQSENGFRPTDTRYTFIALRHRQLCCHCYAFPAIHSQQILCLQLNKERVL